MVEGAQTAGQGKLLGQSGEIALPIHGPTDVHGEPYPFLDVVLFMHLETMTL